MIMCELNSGRRAESTALVTSECLGAVALFRGEDDKSACQMVETSVPYLLSSEPALLFGLNSISRSFPPSHSGHTDLGVVL